MKDNIKIIITSILIVILISSMIFIYSKNKKEEYKNTDLDVVLSLEDAIKPNSIWCGTFNLIWNDLKNNLVKKDIEFNPQIEIVNNLNKETFTKDELNENSYFKVIGHPTFDLKKEIEEAIKNKFNETSGILDDFDWAIENDEDYFLYAMLKKEFSFTKEFSRLKNSNFKNTKNVKFFGIDGNTNEEVYNQVQVMYYNYPSDFAIKLLTEEKEEVILSRGRNELNLKEIYEKIQDETKKYSKSRSFLKGDTLKVPYLNLKIKKEFTELENKQFSFENGKNYYIEKALQIISFELTEKGGKIKSESGVSVVNFAAIETSSRVFHLDDDFVLFLKESDKELPYFGAVINDIEKFM